MDEPDPIIQGWAWIKRRMREQKRDWNENDKTWLEKRDVTVATIWTRLERDICQRGQQMTTFFWSMDDIIVTQIIDIIVKAKTRRQEMGSILANGNRRRWSEGKCNCDSHEVMVVM